MFGVNPVSTTSVTPRRRWVGRCLAACGILFLAGGTTDAAEAPWERLTSGIQVSWWNPGDACPQVPPLLMLQCSP